MVDDNKVVQFCDLSFTYSMEEENAANLLFDHFLMTLRDDYLFLNFLEKIIALTEGKDNPLFEKILAGYFCNPENFINLAICACDEVVDVCENKYRKEIFAGFNLINEQFQKSKIFRSMKEKEFDDQMTSLGDLELGELAEAFMYAYLDATFFDELSPAKAFIWVIREKMEEIFFLLETSLIEIGFDKNYAEKIIANVKKNYSENGRE